MFATKLKEKIRDPCNGKVLYQSFIIKKNKQSVKQSLRSLITQQPKTLENPNISVIKSVIRGHSKTSHKLSRIQDRLKRFSK